MKLQKLLYILIYCYLFNNSYQKLEDEITKLNNNITFLQNDSFKIITSYTNGKYYIPMSKKDSIKIKIESKNEDLNNYYYKYFYVTEDEKYIFPNDDKYYDIPSKIMVIPESKYVVVELKNKISNNKIFLKSEFINSGKNNEKYENNKRFDNYNSEYKINFFFDFEHFLKDNTFSLIVFFSTFCFATTVSAILIMVDLKVDKKMIFTYNLSAKDNANDAYQKLKKTFINKNVFLFACFLMKYTYPFTNIITIYNYDHPRYIRLFILINKILLNCLICIFFFWILDYNHYLISFLYSLVASFIIYVLTELFTKTILNYNNIRKDIWKPIFENLRKYIFYTVKKNILFNSKWNLIRNRMISYTRICGNIILKKKPDDKYKIYANNKKKCNQSLSIDYISNNNIYIKSQSSDEKDSEVITEKLTSNSLNIKPNINNNLLSKNNSMKKRKKTFFAQVSTFPVGVRLCIEKSVQSFSFSKLGQNNLKLKTVQKIEDIRNRYINVNDIKYNEILDISSFAKTYENLEIETLENYTYISTDSMNNQLRNTNSESNKIFSNLITTLILLLILTLVDFGLIVVYNEMQKNKKKDDYLFKCIIPVIAQITIFNFLLNYFYSLIVSLFIFKCYGKDKKNCIYKMIFKIFVEKYIKYIYKIRRLINKYNKELEFIDK